MSQKQYSTYFLAKCFATYYNSPAYKDGKTIGVLGTVIDNIIHFGTDGWKLKLWPVRKILPEHAQRLLEMRTSINLEGCRIDLTDVPTEGYVVMSAIMNGVSIASENLYYLNKPLFSNEESAFFRGFHYDIGFSYLPSLIEAEIAVDASLLSEGPFWSQARAPRTFRHDYLDGLALLAKYAAAARSPEHIGILNALIGAEMGNNTNELFLGMADVIRKLRKDSDNEHERTNN